MKRMEPMDKLKLAKDLTNVIVCGDVHGKYRELGHRIKERHKIHDSIICAAGDIGLGFHKKGYYLEEFGRLNNIMVENNNLLFMVRGNHDDPSYFNGENSMFDTFSNVILVPDYFVLETGAGNILFIGGATSIDRTHRKLNESYWANEACEYREDMIDNLTQKIDIVITHTAPDYTEPFTKIGLENWCFYDKDLSSDCMIERSNMNSIYQRLKKNGHKIKHWGYGHFHFSKKTKYEDTMFVLCDELELVELNLFDS